MWDNGKALDVRPLYLKRRILLIYHSTNQEIHGIHGSIPCTFNFFFNFFEIRDLNATPLLCNRKLPTTADKHLALQLSSNRDEYRI